MADQATFTKALDALDQIIGHNAHDLTFGTSNWTLEHWLPSTFDNSDYVELDAPYQRGSVWTLDQRRALIRSLMIGIPIGSILVANMDGPDKFERIVDGKQRIETIRAFVNDEFDIPAGWVRGAVGGDATVRWSDMDVRTQRRFRNLQMPAITFDSSYTFVLDDDGNYIREGVNGAAKRRQLSAADQLRFERCVYLLVNAGGTDHTDSDLDVL